MSDAGISKGSYTQRSFLSLKELNNAPPAQRGLDGLRAESSRTSLSQLKLDKLIKGKNWEVLENYDLEELRDGFFDPVFTKHEKVTSDQEQDIGEEYGSKSSIFSYFSHWNNSFSDFFSIEWSNVRNNWISLFKFFIPFFISLCICVIHKSGSWIGHKYRYFMPIGVLIHHPVRNIGVQFEMSLWSILGAALGLGWSSLTWYISTATKPTANHQGGILFMSFFIAVLLSTWLRTYYQRFFYLSLSFGIAVIFLTTSDLVYSKHDLDWKMCWDFGISYLFGILLSLLTCVVISPHSGHSEIVNKFSSTIQDVKALLVTLVNLESCNDLHKLHVLQQKLNTCVNIDLSEGFREFSNQWKITKLDEVTLKKLRNCLTVAVSPLRVLPLDHKLLTKVELERLYKAHGNKKENTEFTTDVTPMVISGTTTPLPKANGSLPLVSLSTDIYASFLRSAFSKSIFSLILEMIIVLETMDTALSKFASHKVSEKTQQELQKKLEESTLKLKRKIYRLDVCYKEFTKTNFFCKDLLSDPQSVDIFLFLRYLRQSAKNFIAVNDSLIKLSEDLRWRVIPPHYPLHRALTRLPSQCALDQGAGSVLHYFETKRDVDDAFEQLYNSYTSRHTYSKSETGGRKIEKTVRAIDHNDFNFHTTDNTLRYKLWLVSTKIVGFESKWALKVAFVMTFLALPTWLPQSTSWYQEYQCWWGPMIFFILSNRRNSGTWSSLLRRFLCALAGIFWGWCANQARHFSSPYVVVTFASLFCIPFSINFLVYKNTKSSLTALLCLTIITLEPYSKGPHYSNTATIWKNTWVTGLSLIIGVLLSVPISWILWSFMARSELRVSISSLLAHISQSYQSVTDRYLYRDADDDPTELTLKFSNIREVRLSQSLTAIKELLARAKEEPNYISNFKPHVYQQLIESCDLLLEKIIEARMSGQYFQVWDQDSDNEVTRALLSLRRDSVSSVIFVFYILSNCFRSKNKVPKYLPNPVFSRKKLYDFISKFENMRRGRESHTVSAGAMSSTPDKASSLSTTSPVTSDTNNEKSYWTEVHGMAFARAFTDITQELQKVIELSKEILGEELY